MLLIFASLPDYSFFGVLLLRLGVSLWFLASGSSLLSGRTFLQDTGQPKNRSQKYIGTIDAAVGIFLLLGAFTQVFALIGALMSAVRLAKRHKKTEYLFLFLLLTLACLGLATLGPGPLSFDLPL